MHTVETKIDTYCAQTWCNNEGTRYKRERLVAAMEPYGYKVPSRRSFAYAVGNAAYAFYGSQPDKLVRPLKNQSKDGWQIEEEIRGSSENKYRKINVIKYRCKNGSTEINDYFFVDEWGNECCEPDKFFDYVERAIDELMPSDISELLKRIITSAEFNGTRIANGGGWYWLSYDKLPELKKIVAAVAECCTKGTHEQGYAEVRMNEDGVEALVNSLTAQIDNDFSRIKGKAGKVDEHGKPLLGGDAAKETQRLAIERSKERIDHFAKHIGLSLDYLTDKANEAQDLLVKNVVTSMPSLV